MTLTAVIVSQSFLRTWTSAPLSHKTAAFMINIAYCFFLAIWSLPFELFLGEGGTSAIYQLWQSRKQPSTPEGPARWHGVGTLSALCVMF